jgi:hypothetical protein
MILRHWSLVIFTALVVVACIAIPFFPQTAQPVNATVAGGGKDPTMTFVPSTLGVSMPVGLQVGDVAHLSDMSPETRSFFMVGGSNVPVGTIIDMPIRRADGIHHIPMQFVRVNFLNGSPMNMATELAGYALTVLMAGLGLLLLWRGHSRAASGVALWCLASFVQTAVSAIALPVPYGNLLNSLCNTLDAIGTLVGLYLIADGLTQQARTPQRRRRAHWVFTIAVALYSIGVCTINWYFYLHGNFDMFGAGSAINIDWAIALHLLCFAIPLSMLLTSYRRCDPVNKARIRWILFSLLGLVITYALSLSAGRLNISFELLNLGGTALTGATFVGFAYAVLKHRLVSLQFVLNRALVYGLITSLVVGVFAAMLSFLEHETLNTETNRSLALLVPLILGMGLNTLKRNVDEYINKIFFRHRHKAEASLAQFARTCAYVENPDTLLDLTADELFRHGTPQSLAIYLTEPGKAGAKLVRERGKGSYTAHLNIDDLGLLRLRAGDLEVDLHGVASGLGAEGNVYALTVRGQVLGLIVLGARPAEAYTQEERRLFALVAHQVAVALHALRLEEEHRLLKELAEGTFKSLPTAQAKAKELIGVAG